MPVNVQASFTSIGEPSAVMDADQGAFKLTVVGLDASNTVKTQFSTDNGAVWADDATFNADQTATVVTPAAGRQYRLFPVTMQALKTIAYKMSREN